ncbi:MAG: hypothetical protein Kow0060_21900 [Methylohalobius crimeensis]
MRYQISWLIFGFATVFFLFFAFDVEGLLLNRGKIAHAQGRLLEQQDTLFAEGMISVIGIPTGERKPVYRYRYHFEVGGTAYEGRSLAPQQPWQAGQAVTVEYLVLRPCISRIHGAAAGLGFKEKVPKFIVLAVLLIAAASVASITRWRLRWYVLMKSGMTAQVTATEKRLLSRTRHGREWYQVVWEFETGGRRYTLTQRPYYTDSVEVGEKRTVLYDRRSPNKAIFFDQRVSLDTKECDTTTAASSVRLMLIPMVSLFAIVIAIYLELPC